MIELVQLWYNWKYDDVSRKCNQMEIQTHAVKYKCLKINFTSVWIKLKLFVSLIMKISYLLYDLWSVKSLAELKNHCKSHKTINQRLWKVSADDCFILKKNKQTNLHCLQIWVLVLWSKKNDEQHKNKTKYPENAKWMQDVSQESRQIVNFSSNSIIRILFTEKLVFAPNKTKLKISNLGNVYLCHFDKFNNFCLKILI